MGKATKKYYFYLFAACVVAFVGVFLCHLVNGKTFVWSDDGVPLYLNFLIYEGELIRRLFSDIVSGSYEGFPLYSFSMGYGSDALTSFAGSINDPLNLLSAFCPPRYAEYLYAGLIFVRVYLCAVTFSIYALNRGNRCSASFCGALCYAFSGYAVAWGMLRHPSFLTVMLLFPVVLMGADKVFEKKSPALLIVSAALSFFTSLYFSYMLVLLLVVYCAVFYSFSSRDKSIKDFVLTVCSFSGFLLISFLLAAAMALPVMLVLLSLGRVDLEMWVPLLHSSRYYLSLPSSLLGGTTQTRGLVIGSASLFCTLAFVLCGKPFGGKERKPILVFLGICLLFILLPFFGHALNGFSYVSDRWMFGFCFCTSYVVCKVVPNIGRMSSRDCFVVTGVCGLYAVLVVVLDSGGDYIWRTSTAALFFLEALFFLVASRRPSVGVFSGLFSSVVIFGVAVFSAFYCWPSVGGAIEGFGDRGTPWQKIEERNPYESAKSLVEDDFRVSACGKYTYRNAALLPEVKGIDFFSSFYVQAIDDFRQEVGMSDHYANYIYTGSDSRYALDALSGAKYFIARESESWRVPYGYGRVADLGSGYYLCETGDALPMVFVYDKWISEKAYQELDMVQKQEALLQGCVVEDSSVDEADSVGNMSCVLKSNIVSSEGLTVDDGVIWVNSAGACLTLDVENCRESELYVCFDKLACRSFSDVSAEDSLVGRISNDLFARESSSFDIVAATPDGRRRSILSVNGRDVAYGGKQDWVVNMGYFEEGCDEVILEFPDTGVYTFEQISVVSQPVAPLVERVRQLNADDRVDYAFGVNEINASVHLDGARLVYFSVPYSTGWKAYSNGEPVEIMEANTAFMAIELDDAGDYEISLRYETPGLRTGSFLSLLGMAVLLSIMVLPKLRDGRRLCISRGNDKND